MKPAQKTRPLWWLLSLLLCLSPSVRATTNAEEVEEDQRLDSTFVTPHKSWAKPYAGGRLRALFIINPGNYSGSWFAPGTRLREVVELGERFDLESDAFFFGGRGGGNFLGDALGRNRAEKLLGKPYDVYVIGGTTLAKLPPKFQYLLMKRVADGAGLVCCGPGAGDFMTASRLLKPLPLALTSGLPSLDDKVPGDVMSAYRLGKGHGVWLKYGAWALTPRNEFSWAGLALYDYRMLWVGRAALWAAGAAPKTAMAFEVASGDAPGQPDLTLAVSGPKSPRLTIVAEVRRIQDGAKSRVGRYRMRLSGDQPWRKAVALPPLRAGRYMIDAVARSSAGVVAFAATDFVVESAFGVADVALDHPFVEVGETIRGTVRLRGAPPAGSVVEIRFRDSHDRVLARREMAVADAAEYAFSYTATAFSTIWMRAQAVLLADDREIELREATFTVPKRRRDRFNFLQWDTPTDVLGYFAWQQMRDAGMDLCLLSSFSESKFHPVLAAADIPIVPYTTRIQDPKDDKGFMKLRPPEVKPAPHCWNDEPAIDAYVKNIMRNQQKRREHGVFCYSLGDEGVTKGCCVHPAGIAAYRRFLQTQYPNIQALNASWEAEYKSFAEVDLLDHKDNMEEAALRKGLYARWYDRQAFARYNLAWLSKRFGDVYRTLDPKAITGFEGTGRFGDDYDTIIGMNGFYGPYPSLGDDIVRSRAPRSRIRSNWMGYSKTGDALSDAAWRMVMKGMDSIWYWMWTGVGSWRGYVTPTLDLYPATADLTREMKPVNEGLGDLIIHSQMSHSGIAILYSLPSALSHGIEHAPSFEKPDRVHKTWTNLIYELGMDFRYITDDMLRDGTLTTSEFKVLILPTSMAIAPGQATLIRRYAEAGGNVIADVRPGIFDGHCKPLEKGSLDELFGIRRTSRGDARRTPVALAGTLDGKTFDATFAEACLDPGIEVDTATALCRVDKVPTLLRNKVGRGRATLLNFQLLSGKEDKDQTEVARKLVRVLLETAGVAPEVTATAPNGGTLPSTEMRVWRNGDARIFGLWRRMECAWFSPKSGVLAGPPQPARVTLPESLCVYDLRAGKYLGKKSEVDTRLHWGRANFFCALPYRIGRLKLSLSSRSPARGDTITASIRLGVPVSSTARHAVSVTLEAPDGTDVRWARQVVLLKKGQGTILVPVAFNDAAGAWRIHATELFSGRKATAKYRLSRR